MYTKALENGWQTLTHATGDRAIDKMIMGWEKAEAAVPGVDVRPVLIHGQTLRKDQVAELKTLGIFPSLFPMHTFYWGDWHRDSVLGPERAENISPTGWVREAGMRFTTHHDAPVALPNAMRVLDATVNRTTRSGKVLGEAQKVSVMTALKAMTIWSAYQHFEEASKGSIEVGKQADIVLHAYARPEWRPGLDVINSLVYSAQSVAVDTVIVGGEIILENGRFKRVDEEAEYRRIDRAARELYQRMGRRDRARWPVL